MSDAKTQTVVRERVIDAPAQAIYTQLADFHNWPQWSPWYSLDPDQTVTYKGPDSGVGAYQSWSGNRKVGQGEMTITAAQPGERVEIDLNFIKPFKSQNKTIFEIEPQGDKSRVRWTMIAPETGLSRVMRMFTLTMDKMVGKDFEKGLDGLERVTQAAPSQAPEQSSN